MTEIRKIVDEINQLGSVERRELMTALSQNPNDDNLSLWAESKQQLYPSVVRNPDVCGGSARLIRTRIPVWTIERMRQLGVADGKILQSYPSLQASDLVQAFAYAEQHREEIEKGDPGKRKRVIVARIYSNENFPLPVVEQLRGLGHDVVTLQEREMANVSVPDPEVLDFAIAEERAVLTLNRRDFIRLHSRRPDHFGIVVCTVDPDFEALANRIDDAIRHVQDLKGKLVRVNRPNEDHGRRKKSGKGVDISSYFVRATAKDDQRLQVFKEFFLAAEPDARVRLYEYIKAIAALSPEDLERSVQFAEEIGCTGDSVIGVQVYCLHMPDGPSAEIDPHLLVSAMEAWNRGEEYLPPVF